jgi:hypothetical protein
LKDTPARLVDLHLAIREPSHCEEEPSYMSEFSSAPLVTT